MVKGADLCEGLQEGVIVNRPLLGQRSGSRHGRHRDSDSEGSK